MMTAVIAATKQRYSSAPLLQAHLPLFLPSGRGSTPLPFLSPPLPRAVPTLPVTLSL